MWHVVKGTVYDPSSEKRPRSSFTVESSWLDVLMVETADSMVREIDRSPPVKELPLRSYTVFVLEVTSTHSCEQAVTRDMEAARILQKMRNCLVPSPSSLDSALLAATLGTSNGSSPN